MLGWLARHMALMGLLAALIAPALAGEPPRDTPATLQFELAQRLRAEKLYKTAVSQYEKFIALHGKDPRYPEALFWLADCHYQLNQHKEAAAYYEELCRDYKKSDRYAWALSRLGHCRLVLEQYDPAIAALLELEKLPPPAELVASTSFYLGRAYHKKADYPHALANFEKVIADAKADAQFRSLALFWAADVHQRTSQFDKAVPVYLQLLKEYPEAPLAGEANFRLAECHQRLGQHDKAIELFTLAEKDAHFTTAALYGRAVSLAQLKKHADAVKPAEQITSKFPDSPEAADAFLLTARCYLELKQYADAAKNFEALAAKFPKATSVQEAMLKTCWCYYYLGNEQNTARIKACLLYIDKYPAAPDVGDAHFLLADAYAALGQLDKAIASFEAVPQGTSFYERARFRVALSYHQARDLVGAAVAYDDLVAKFPKHEHAPDALMQAGLIYFHQAGTAKTPPQQRELYAKAEQRLDEFLKRFPTHKQAPEVLFTKGESQRLQSKFAEMASSFEQYVQIKGAPNASTAFFWLGRHWQRLGDELRRAADAAAEQKQLPQAREQYRHAAERHLKAVDAYRQSVQLGGTAAKEARVRLAAASYAAGASQATEVQYLAADAKAARDAKNDALAQQLDQQAAALSKSSDERLDDAATTYFAAMTESPDLVAEDRIYKWTAARSRSRGKQPEAIALYKVLLERWPKVDYRDRVLCELGSLYTELPQPDWAASLASYQQVLDEYAVVARDTPATPRPMETYAQYGKALALKNTGGLAGAAELLAEVIRNVPDGEALNVRARVELGEICFKQAEALAAANDAAGATKKYLEARNLLLMVDLLFDDPEFTPRALYWTGLCTAALNDVPEAARMWAVLLKNYPASDWAKRAREELKKRGIVVSEKGEIVP